MSSIIKSLSLLMSNDEQIECIKRIKSGEKGARNEFIEKNGALILFEARKFWKNYSQEFEDLCSVGFIGLIDAISNFDLSMNVNFSTYASKFILGRMKTYLRDFGDQLRLRVVKEKNNLIFKFKQQYLNDAFTIILNFSISSV